MERFAELKALKDQYTEKIKTQGEALMKDALRDFFDSHPEVEGVRWRQYTPYFNDGDACIFGLRGFAIRKVGWAAASKISWPAAGEGDGDGWEEVWKDPYAELEKELSQNKYVLEAVFGDHAEVEASRNEVKVTSYEHD